MFGFGKKKKDEEDNMPSFGNDKDSDLESGEGKFPPPEQAFNEPTTPIGNDTGLPPLPDSPSMPPLEPERPNSLDMASKPQPITQNPSLSGDKIEVVIAKIDSLKNMIEVLNQRIANLEQRIANNERRW